MDTISAESERVAFLRFLNLYFRLGIAICNGLPRDGGYILKVFHALTPSICLGWYMDSLGRFAGSTGHLVFSCMPGWPNFLKLE